MKERSWSISVCVTFLLISFFSIQRWGLKTFYQLYQTTPSIKKREVLKKENPNDEDKELVKLWTRLLNYIFSKFEDSNDAYKLAGIPLNKQLPKSKYNTLEEKKNSLKSKKY